MEAITRGGEGVASKDVASQTSDPVPNADNTLAGYVQVLRRDGLGGGRAARLERGLHHAVVVTPELVARFPRTAQDLALAGERVAVLQFIFAPIPRAASRCRS